MHKFQKAVVISSLLLLSIPAFATCPDPATQCPPTGSSRQDALNCGWTELFGTGTVNDPLNLIKGPIIKAGASYCVYDGSAIGGIGQLMQVLPTPTSVR